MGDIINYEPILWLIPHQYGVRPRDGKWIDKRVEKINLPKVKIVPSISEAGDVGPLIYATDTHSFFYVRGGPGNRMFLKIS